MLVRMEFFANLLAQQINRPQLAAFLVVPERPPVARFSPLNMGANLVDGTGGIFTGKCAVGADTGSMAACWIIKNSAGLQETALDNRPERHARFRFFRLRNLNVFSFCNRC